MNWIFFPRTNEIPKFLVKTILIFEKYEKKIDSRQRNNSKNRLDSDSVLKILTPDLLKLGFKVEKSKKKRRQSYNSCSVWKFWEEGTYI